LQASFLEKLVWSRGVVITCGAIAAASLWLIDGVFVLLLFIYFWLCASLMSRLVLVIMLLQRLGVIYIILVLIYSHYQKKRQLLILHTEWVARRVLHVKNKMYV
jgi:hypothetical protein